MKPQSVRTNICQSELLRALFHITIYAENFNPDEWCVGNADDLIRAGEMIKREIAAKKAKGE